MMTSRTKLLASAFGHGADAKTTFVLRSTRDRNPSDLGQGPGEGVFVNVGPELDMKGMVVIDVVDRRIRFIEVIDGPSIRASLDNFEPSLPFESTRSQVWRIPERATDGRAGFPPPSLGWDS